MSNNLMSGYLLIPSLNRPARVQRLAESYVATSAEVPTLVLVDNNDPSLIEYFNLKLPLNWAIMLTQGVSMGDKVRAIWPIVSKLEFTMLANDDHVFKTDRWDVKVAAALRATNGMVSTADGWTDERNALPKGLTAWSGDLLRAVGYIFPKGLNHMFIDNIWRDIGLGAECWDVLDQVVVEHEHATRDEKWKDSTHLKSESFFHADAGRYMGWRNGSEYVQAIAAAKATVSPRLAFGLQPG